MTEFLLDESQWPAGLPEPARSLLRRIVAGVRRATEAEEVAVEYLDAVARRRGI